jgi:MFS family permease
VTTAARPAARPIAPQQLNIAQPVPPAREDSSRALPSGTPQQVSPVPGGPTRGTARPAMFASLRARNFRIFVSGQVVSNTGAWTQRVAQDWLVLTLTGSAAAVGITTAMQFLPTLIFGMLGGLAADRFDKRRILLTTQSVLGLCSAGLALLCLTGAVQFWHILVIAFVGGTAAAFDNPTRQSFVHEMVGPRHLRNAVSINSAVFQLGALVGPAISSLLITAVGIGWAFAATSASFGVVVVALAVIRSAELHRVAALPRGRGQMRSAFGEIGRRPELLWPLVLAGVCGFFSSNFPVSLTAFAKDFGLGPAGYGLLTCSLAVGSLTGALISARRPGARLRNLVELSMGLAAAQLLAASMPNLVTLALALAVMGAACVPFGIAANSTIQLAAGDAMRGRVMGVYMLVVIGAAAAGGPVVGFLAEVFGARAGLIAGGLVVSVAAVYVCRRLAHATNIALQPQLRSEVAKVRGWLVAATGR